MANLLEQQTGQEAAASAPAVLRSPPAELVPVIERMRACARLTGLSFVCVDAEDGRVLARSDANAVPRIPAEVLERLADADGVHVVERPSGLLFYTVPVAFSSLAGRSVVAGCVPSRAEARLDELVTNSDVPGPSSGAAGAYSHGPVSSAAGAPLHRWLSRQPCCHPRLLRKTLELAVRHAEREGLEQRLQDEVSLLSDQIDRTYEEISLLHALARNLHLSRSPAELAELCLARMEELIESDADVIWLEEAERPQILVRGTLPFEQDRLPELLARLETADWSRPLVQNYLQQTPLGAEFPGLTNLVLVPVAEGAWRSGWILSVNLSRGREFGTVEASLLNSIATILGTHIRNIDLYREHHELLLAFVCSLVSTLDAKDPYTRGHSERVALIARRLGQEMGLPEDDLHDIYVAGLLHDIGKIGVDDRILQKPGSLTDDEFEQVKQHPMIGYVILKELKNLQQILPGVRNHHEAWDGRGYPDGLRAEQIPLMARILAVADSYDAMGSDRPYRQGMPLEKVEAIFRKGAGEQWDSHVIDAYFACRDDVRRICETYSPADGNLLRRGVAT